jgi:hypothetical protein
MVPILLVDARRSAGTWVVFGLPKCNVNGLLGVIDTNIFVWLSSF